MKHFVAAVSAMLVLHGTLSRADGLAFETVKLPALRIDGQPARAHTQGLEVAGGKYYVTARREDTKPKRALLLRTEAAGSDWEVWDITPIDALGAVTVLDHLGECSRTGNACGFRLPRANAMVAASFASFRSPTWWPGSR